MKEKLFHPATFIALAALFVALSGTSYAVSQLPKNSVGQKQLKKKSVTKSKIAKNAVDSSKVKNESLLAEDFKSGQLPQGAKGDTGAQGPQGARGPSDGYVGNRNPSSPLTLSSNSSNPTTVATSQQLPAGSYIASARANLFSSGGASSIICSFGDDAIQSLAIDAGKQVPLTMASGFKLAEDGKITMRCSAGVDTVTVFQAAVVATRVESLATETTN